jgi:hypothetical protein
MNMPGEPRLTLTLPSPFQGEGFCLKEWGVGKLNGKAKARAFWGRKSRYKQFKQPLEI